MSITLRWAIIGVLLAHFALVLQYSLRNPLGEAPDEADHWAYTVYLAKEARLPEGPALTQAKHPPLYYLGAALFAALGEPSIDFFHPNPALNLAHGPGYSPAFFTHEDEGPPWNEGPLAFHLARLWSALLSTATVAATFALARAAFPARPVVAVAAAGVLAFTPEFLFIGGSINNDNGAAFWGAMALWGGMAIFRNDGRARAGWWAALALGAGVLSKVSSIALWPAVALAIAIGAWSAFPRQWGPWLRRTLTTSLVIFTPAILIAAPWFLRNRRLYGDLLGMHMALLTIDARTAAWTWADSQWLLRGWFLSFWGKFGGAGHLPMPNWFYALVGAATLMALIGLIWLVWRGAWQGARAAVLILGAAVVSVMAVIFRYSLDALGTDQGRLLYPALAAIVVLFAAGIMAWVPSRWYGVVAASLIGAFAAAGIYGLWGVLLPALGGA